MQIGVITNPQSRRNRHSPGRADRLATIAGDHGLVRQTRGVGEIRAAVEDLLDGGASYLLSDGGDGSYHWLVNVVREVAEARGAAMPCVVPTSGGTIDFVTKKAGLTTADVVLAALVQHLKAGRPVETAALATLDVTGRYAGQAAGSFRRLGFATAIGGVGQRFFSAYYEEPSQGGLAALLLILKAATGIVGSLPGVRRTRLVSDHYRSLGARLTVGTRARVTSGERVFPETVFQGLHAGSIDVDLGAVRLFPLARPGQLHLVVGEMTPLEAAWKWAFLAAGRPAPGPRWHEFGGTELRVSAPAGEALDPVIDGECYSGVTELEVRPGPPIQIPILKLARTR